MAGELLLLTSESAFPPQDDQQQLNIRQIHHKPPTMDRPNDPNLLGLPVEIRHNILEMVVFHDKTGGVITPSQECSRDKYRKIILSSRDERDLPHSTHIDTDDCDGFYDSFSEDFLPFEEDKRLLDAWSRSPTKKSRHLCDLECLLQPPITMVSRQLREEALPLFYRLNHFHIEMLNFVEERRGGCECKLLESPTDWWRAIGDENINSIGCLSFGSEEIYYELRRSKGNIHETHYNSQRGNTQTRILGADAVFDYPSSIGSNRKARRDAVLRVKARGMRGIHKEVLEGIVAWQDPHVAYHLENGHLRRYESSE